MRKRICKFISAVLCAACLLCSFGTPAMEVSAAGRLETLLNSAPLNPALSLSQPTNQVVEAVLSQITTADMTTYQKVKACYDYLINTCEYGGKMKVVDASDAAAFANIIDMCAYDILCEHVGVCDDYTAAFVALTRAIGLESYSVGGQTSSSRGGYTPHAWAVVILEGQEYVFDPQIEDNIAKGGAIRYYRFGKTYAEVPNKYIPNGSYQVISGSAVTFGQNAIPWGENEYCDHYYTRYDDLNATVEKYVYADNPACSDIYVHFVSPEGIALDCIFSGPTGLGEVAGVDEEGALHLFDQGWNYHFICATDKIDPFGGNDFMKNESPEEIMGWVEGALPVADTYVAAETDTHYMATYQILLPDEGPGHTGFVCFVDNYITMNCEGYYYLESNTVYNADRVRRVLSSIHQLAPDNSR